ncbi:MAG: TRAP transporter large permease [Spirochaetales bacterium]|jgi:tripartite ATP-independent transporter DctM subunit|nr:TRAP transporter large permease [Spirochaetales bacterium]
MTTSPLAISLLLGVFAVLIVLRLPVSFCLGIASVVTAFHLNLPVATLFQRMINGIQSFNLLAIPFFILAGEIMGQGGISDRLITFANALVGRFRGGLAHVNILASTFFGGISGSAVADTSSIGAVLIPMMEKSGYDRDFSVAITVTSSCQGVMIPPSHNMILFSLAAGGVSIGKLFLGGLIPGLILGFALMTSCYIISVKKNYPKGDKVPLRQVFKHFCDAFLGLFTCIIIVGGVLTGLFTATESASLAVVYAFFVTFFVYREIPLKQIIPILRKALRTISMVLALIATASMFGWMLAYLKIPAIITQTLLGFSQNKALILILINIVCLFLGCIMDMGPLILILTPILLPVATRMGMDPVHFGAILVFNLSIGLCTPPVGAALFAGCSIGKIKIEKVSVACLPFYFTMVLVLIIITAFPAIVLTIPNWLMG